MAEAVSAVLLDFGGVIAEEGFREGLYALAGEQGLDPEWLAQEGMDAVYDSGYVTGEGAEAGFWALLRNRTGLRGSDERLRQHILARFIVRPEMIELVDRLRRSGHLIGLLSDQTDWIELLDREQHFLNHFDILFISYRMGKGKRDASLFGDVAQHLKLPPKEILFIDDNPENVERAESQGMRGMVFVDQRSLGQRLRDELGLRF